MGRRRAGGPPPSRGEGERRAVDPHSLALPVQTLRGKWSFFARAQGEGSSAGAWRQRFQRLTRPGRRAREHRRRRGRDRSPASCRAPARTRRRGRLPRHEAPRRESRRLRRQETTCPEARGRTPGAVGRIGGVPQPAVLASPIATSVDFEPWPATTVSAAARRLTSRMPSSRAPDIGSRSARRLQLDLRRTNRRPRRPVVPVAIPPRLAFVGSLRPLEERRLALSHADAERGQL